MAKVPAKDVKLIGHRWAMHAIQALAQRDFELLRRVFTEIRELPENAVNIQIKAFGAGAPMQFHDYGFFAESSSSCTPQMFDRAIDGDTLLLIALRRHDPSSATALIECHASLDLTNSIGQRPLDILFDRFATMQLYSRHESGTKLERTPAGDSLEPILCRRIEYDSLFVSAGDRLRAHHRQIRYSVQNELYRIYAQHAPERLAKVNDLMRDFEFRETELLRGVQQKYES